MTDDTGAGVKIGELLIAVGSLTSGDLTEAIQISKRMGVPIGRVLVMSGCVTEANLQQALKLQSMVKDNLVDLDTGINALKMVFKDKVELEDALKTFNWTPNKDQAGNKLGDLLVDSTIVSRGQLERALEASFQSGMPLGGTLVLQGVLSPMLLPTVLHTQEQIRDGKMTREEAIGELKMALMFWAKAGESKQEEFQTAPGRSAEAAAATGETFKPAPAAAPAPGPAPMVKSPPPPQAVPQPQPASQQLDEFTRPHTQQPPYVHPNSTPGSATEMAQAPYNPSAASTGAPNMVQQSGTAGSDEQPSVISLVELLKLSGHCTQASLEQQIRDALADNRVASKVLLAASVLDSDTLNMYVRCQALIVRGVLRTDQVLYALNSVRHRKIPLEQAIAELGVQVPV